MLNNKSGLAGTKEERGEKKRAERGALEKLWEALVEQRVCVRAFNDSDLSKTLQRQTRRDAVAWQAPAEGEWFLVLSPSEQADARGCWGESAQLKLDPRSSELNLRRCWVAGAHAAHWKHVNSLEFMCVCVWGGIYSRYTCWALECNPGSKKREAEWNRKSLHEMYFYQRAYKLFISWISLIYFYTHTHTRAHTQINDLTLASIPSF